MFLFFGLTPDCYRVVEMLSVCHRQIVAGTIVMDDYELSPGDVIFFGKLEDKSESGFEDAILKSVAGNLYHVAIAVNDQDVVHACSDVGVVLEKIGDALDRIEPDFVQICNVQVPEEVKSSAVSNALDRLNLPYNDLFTPDHLNSEGKYSYYCSQLIIDCFPSVSFPPHKMRFSDADGHLIPYWIDYYKERGRKVPEGEDGSHPSQLRKSHLFTCKKVLNGVKVGK